MKNDLWLEFVGGFIVIGMIALFVLAWKTHEYTGLTVGTLFSLGRNYLVLIVLLAAVKFQNIYPVKYRDHIGLIIAAILYASLPAANELGRVHFGDIIDDELTQWYAKPFWQTIGIVMTGSSQYLFRWYLKDSV